MMKDVPGMNLIVTSKGIVRVLPAGTLMVLMAM